MWRWNECVGAGVTLQDLKPNNLLISREDYAIKIADFGLARQFAGDEKRLSPDVITRFGVDPFVSHQDCACVPLRLCCEPVRASRWNLATEGVGG